MRLFPDFVNKADELALNFDHDLLYVRSNFNALLNETQNAFLSALDEKLNLMSGADTTIWTDDALYNHPAWEDVRQLAKQILAAFGWNEDFPPSDRHRYIRA